MQKNPTIISLVLTGVLALGSMACARATAQPAPSASPTPQERITEDDPRWDCRTMGNKICGPGAKKPAYYCGAPTKKGTACKRRVKGQGLRCWQHKGAK